MLGNIEIKRIMSEGGVLWEKKLDLKPKYSWWSNDTSTYVESFRLQNGKTAYRMKSRFVDNNKIGMWVYEIDKGESYSIKFGSYIATIEVDIPRNNLETTSGKYLQFSNNFMEKYKEPITNFYYYFSDEISVRRIYYYEYSKNISLEEYGVIKEGIRESLYRKEK